MYIHLSVWNPYVCPLGILSSVFKHPFGHLEGVLLPVLCLFVCLLDIQLSLTFLVCLLCIQHSVYPVRPLGNRHPSFYPLCQSEFHFSSCGSSASDLNCRITDRIWYLGPLWYLAPKHSTRPPITSPKSQIINFLILLSMVWVFVTFLNVYHVWSFEKI